MRTFTTIGDTGEPSDSCQNDAERVLQLMDDQRFLVAFHLYQSVQERIGLYESSILSSSHPNKGGGLKFRRTASKSSKAKLKQDVEGAQKSFKGKEKNFQDLESKCLLLAKAKQNLDVDDDWTLAQTLFGVTTFYRREPDGSLSIKLEGHLKDVSLFDEIAVLREVDLHYKWAPFCSSSLTVSHLDKMDTVGWFVVGLPNFGLMRDGCFRVVGCDSMLEDGSILLVGQGIDDKPKEAFKKKMELKRKRSMSSDSGSVLNPTSERVKSSLVEEAVEFNFLTQDPVLKELDLPEPPTRMGSGRMTIRTFQAIIHVESPTQARTRIVANIDPNLPLIPQSLLDFLMKKLCGVLLGKLQGAAKKVSKDPVYNPHACKMRQEEGFYKVWLMEKFEGFCKLRGWEMPRVAAFALTPQQIELAEAAEQKLLKDKAHKAVRIYHSLSQDKLDDFLDTNTDEIDSGRSEPNCVGAHDGPRVRAITQDSDSISDISRNSSSTFSTFFQNNPLSVYLRELEEKTQLRKARKVEKLREKAANRLKPKEMGPDSLIRLEELRQARQRRALALKNGTKDDIPDNDLTQSQRDLRTNYKRDWATMWTSHGVFTKAIVLSFLLMTLFVLLYIDPAFEDFIVARSESWVLGREKDILTILYLGVSACVHFSLCYVALMYAFSALQLGSIAGSEARKFYSENVHLIVAVFSAFLVLLGITTSTSVGILRWFIWRIVAVSRDVSSDTSTLSNTLALAIPQSLEPYIESVGSLYGQVQSGVNFAYQFLGNLLGNLLLPVVSVLNHYILDSNIAGRVSKEAVVVAVSSPVLILFHACRAFVDDSVSRHEDGSAIASWRENVFLTTRAFLAYTAVFLLVLLVLFNLLAKHARGVPHSSAHATPASNSAAVTFTPYTPGKPSSMEASPPQTAVMTLSPKSRKRSYTRSLSPRFDCIEEETEEIVDVVKPNRSRTKSEGFLGSDKENKGLGFLGKKKKEKKTKASKVYEVKA